MYTYIICSLCDGNTGYIREQGEKAVHKNVNYKLTEDSTLWSSKVKFPGGANGPLKKYTRRSIT